MRKGLFSGLALLAIVACALAGTSSSPGPGEAPGSPHLPRPPSGGDDVAASIPPPSSDPAARTARPGRERGGLRSGSSRGPVNKVKRLPLPSGALAGLSILAGLGVAAAVRRRRLRRSRLDL